MDQFFTWSLLGELAGAAAAVGLLTQFTKKYAPIPTQALSYIFAIVILAMATYFNGNGEAATFAIIPFNAMIVSMSSNGGYSAITRAFGNKNVDGVLKIDTNNYQKDIYRLDFDNPLEELKDKTKVTLSVDAKADLSREEPLL